MPGEDKPTVAAPDRESLIREELRRVLVSNAFRASRRAAEFLELIVEHALAGRFDSLRERMLGAEMFGRPVDYDAANDAVVRVKGHRGSPPPDDVLRRPAHAIAPADRSAAGILCSAIHRG